MCKYYPGTLYEPPDFIECDAYTENLDEIMRKDGNENSGDPTEEQMQRAEFMTHGDPQAEREMEEDGEFDTNEEADYA